MQDQEMHTVGQMGTAEYERFVAYMQNLDIDHRAVAIRQFSDDELWDELRYRYSDMKIRDDYYRNAPRA